MEELAEVFAGKQKLSRIQPNKVGVIVNLK